MSQSSIEMTIRRRGQWTTMANGRAQLSSIVLSRGELRRRVSLQGAHLSWAHITSSRYHVRLLCLIVVARQQEESSVWRWTTRRAAQARFTFLFVSKLDIRQQPVGRRQDDAMPTGHRAPAESARDYYSTKEAIVQLAVFVLCAFIVISVARLPPRSPSRWALTVNELQSFRTGATYEHLRFLCLWQCRG